MARMRQQLVSTEGWAEGTAPRPRHAPAPAPAFAPSGGADAAGVLTRTLERDVIPRLLKVRRPDSAGAARVASAREVMALVDLLLAGDEAAPAGFVGALRAVGTTAESLCLDVLTPAARRLGVMWEEDDCSFSDVTLGLLRLHDIMRALGPDFAPPGLEPDAGVRLAGPRALLVQMPGEQHGLGVGMLAQFFRRAGWDVWNAPVATSSDLVGMVRHREVALVGISVSCSERIEALAADIRAIRRASRNARVRIMVGGPPFLEHPQLASMVGADATALDARQAVRRAFTLISSMARHR